MFSLRYAWIYILENATVTGEIPSLFQVNITFLLLFEMKRKMKSEVIKNGISREALQKQKALKRKHVTK